MSSAGLLFAGKAPICHVHGLVVSEKGRRKGVGRALTADATRRFVLGPGSVEVVSGYDLAVGDRVEVLGSIVLILACLPAW